MLKHRNTITLLFIFGMVMFIWSVALLIQNGLQSYEVEYV